MELKFNSKTGPRFLSNFHPSPIVGKDGKEYATVEHAFQACKTVDAKEREEIRLASSPQGARQLGRKCKMRPNWVKMKLGVMENVLRAKFQNPHFRSLLKGTGDNTLVHLSPWDTFWGVDEKGRGENMLGKLLMKIRGEL